jgi:hypothetical protein
MQVSHPSVNHGRSRVVSVTAAGGLLLGLSFALVGCSSGGEASEVSPESTPAEAQVCDLLKEFHSTWSAAQSDFYSSEQTSADWETWAQSQRDYSSNLAILSQLESAQEEGISEDLEAQARYYRGLVTPGEDVAKPDSGTVTAACGFDMSSWS